jgi:hypothetical protein
VLCLVISVVTGRRLFGKFEVPNAGPVLYIGEELRFHYLQERVSGLLAAQGLSKNLVDGRFKYALREGVKIDDPAWQAKIRRACGGLRPRLVVFDPLSRMLTADENSAREMRSVLGFLRGLEKKFGCAVAVVHHTRKGRDRENAFRGQAIRGTSDFEGAADTIIYSAGHPDRPVTEVHVEHRDAEDPPPFTLELVAGEGTFDLRLGEGGAESFRRMGLAERILDALRVKPEGMTKEELKDAVGGKTEDRACALKDLKSKGLIGDRPDRRKAKDGRMRNLTLWFLVESNPSPTIREEG